MFGEEKDDGRHDEGDGYAGGLDRGQEVGEVEAGHDEGFGAAVEGLVD